MPLQTKALSLALLAILTIAAITATLRDRPPSTTSAIVEREIELEVERQVHGDVIVACRDEGSCTARSKGAEPVALTIHPSETGGQPTWELDGSESHYVSASIVSSIERSRKIDVAVDCPPLIPLRAGSKFTCSLQHDDRQFSVDVTMLDATGRVEWRVA